MPQLDLPPDYQDLLREFAESGVEAAGRAKDLADVEALENGSE